MLSHLLAVAVPPSPNTTDDGKEVLVWVGTNSSPGERQQGLSRAVDYLKAFRRPMTTPISRVLEGGENGVCCEHGAV